MLKEPLDVLLAVLEDFDQHATRDEKKSAISALRRLSRKIEIQSLELQEQRWRLTAAECAGDKETLRDLAEFTQFEDAIASWAREILNVKRQMRSLPCQTIKL
jgi:hypothetical protein